MTSVHRADFELRLRVYWEDTDAGGIVYHANYVKFIERVRSDWLRSKGISQAQAREQFGGIFVVSNLALRYLLPARLDDELLATVQLQTIGRASLGLRQQVLRVETSERVLLCEAEVKIGWVCDASLRPARIPENILGFLS